MSKEKGGLNAWLKRPKHKESGTCAQCATVQRLYVISDEAGQMCEPCYRSYVAELRESERRVLEATEKLWDAMAKGMKGAVIAAERMGRPVHRYTGRQRRSLETLARLSRKDGRNKKR